MNLIRRGLALGFLADEEAATGAEYALLITLIALAIMAGVGLLGNNVANNLYGVAVAQLTFGG